VSIEELEGSREVYERVAIPTGAFLRFVTIEEFACSLSF
jgi:hypothetical protein